MTTGSQSGGQDGDRLDSWKAIAAYIGKDVRTALRWAKDGGMPVYHHSGRKRGPVYAYKPEIDGWIHADRPPTPRFHQKPFFLWTGAALALLLAAAGGFLWLNDAAEEHPIPVGERPWILFSDFQNHSGETRFDGTVETALRRELTKSRHVLVVASERIRDTLALMRLPPDMVIDVELGREICLRYVQRCALLTGRVDKFGSYYLFSMEVVNPHSGLIVATSEEQASNEDDILPAIQRLGVWLRNHMGEELAELDLASGELEKVTTPSLRALELYTRGEQAYRSMKFNQAEGYFREAVAEDPGFASAHLLLYYALNAQRKSPGEGRDFLRRAMELAESTSNQERLFIEGTYYETVEQDTEKACVSFKMLADLFPDHYWAAGNAALVCGERLGDREDKFHYTLLVADMRSSWNWNCRAAAEVVFHEGDYERARHYIERAREFAANLTGARLGAALSCTELFAAEEYLGRGLLPQVLAELQRVEQTLESLENTTRKWVAKQLVSFYLALGRFHDAQTLSQTYQPYRYPELLQGWLAYLRHDETAFRENVEKFRIAFRDIDPDPDRRLSRLVRWAYAWQMEGGFMLDILGPLYEPEEAVVLIANINDPYHHLQSTPWVEAKLQLIRGYLALNRGDTHVARQLLQSGTQWFRDHGSDSAESYFFLGSELLAIALIQSNRTDQAYRVLTAAAEQKNMVNSHNMPLHHRLQARQARLARELGFSAEAEAIETELAQALALADPDHPELPPIREQQEH